MPALREERHDERRVLPRLRAGPALGAQVCELPDGSAAGHQVLLQLRGEGARDLAITMDRRLVVSTECPTCAAPLDFPEGSNAVRCQYCRSNLLVTGRKQVLSYYIQPKVEPRDAARNAFAACREQGWHCRAVKWERYFIPYYRLVGHDLRWERSRPEPSQRELTDDLEARTTSSALNLAVVEALATSAPQALRNLCAEGDHGTFCDRYVDKSFLAADLKDVGVYSLGVKPAVLKLRLFSNEALRPLGCRLSPRLWQWMPP